MAFRKVLAIAVCLAAVAVGAPAPQTTILQPATFLNAVPQIIAHPSGFAAHPAAFAPAVRTFAAVPPPQAVTFQAVNQQPLVQEVRTVQPISVAAPSYGGSSARTTELVEVPDLNPQYSFGYSVADSLSGDSKTREETRDGDVVKGSYSVADPDGRIRRVEYTADKEHGFQATVTYDGQSGPVAIPTANAVPSVVTVPSSAAVVNNQQQQQTVSIIDTRVQSPKVFRTASVAAVSPTVQAFSPAFGTFPLAQTQTQQVVRLADGQTLGLRAFPVDGSGFLSGFQTIDGARIIQV